MIATPIQTASQPGELRAELSLEFVDPLDLDAHADALDFIQAFVASPENADGAISARPEIHYRQAFATGLVVRGHRGGRTTFVQMLYLLPGTERLFVELGTVLNRDRRRGLMEPVVRAVIARTLSVWPMASVYAVAKPGTASSHVLSKVGMRVDLPEPDLVEPRLRIGIPLPDHKEVFSIRLTH